MCVTCYHFKRDLASWGVACTRFFGMHCHRNSKVVDVCFSAGTHLKRDTVCNLVDCLKRNRYACKSINVRNVDGTYYVDIFKLFYTDTRQSSEVRENFAQGTRRVR